MQWLPAPELDALSAIDVHVHAHAPEGEESEAAGAARRYFGESDVPLALDELAAYYRERKMACVVFTVDERLTGRPVFPNDGVLAAARAHPDVLIQFASVDPTRPPGSPPTAGRAPLFGASPYDLMTHPSPPRQSARGP